MVLSCPIVNLVPGVGGDIIGGAPARVPVWETASVFTLPRSRPLCCFSCSCCGGHYDATFPERGALPRACRAAAGDAYACSGHRCSCRCALGGGAAGGCPGTSRQSSTGIAGPC